VADLPAAGGPAEDRSVLTRAAPEPDVVLRYGEHPEQVVDLRLPPAAGDVPVPLVVVVHGGFWTPEYDRTHAAAQSAALADAGYAVATVEYRRGDRDTLVADVRAAVDAAPRLVAQAAPGRVDPAVTVLVGHSAGGHLSLLQAARPGACTAVVALAPVADLAAAEADGLGDGAVRAFLHGTAAEHPDLDPARLPAPGVRVLLVHGETDDLVPPSQSTAYAATHPAVACELVPGAGHFALIDPASAAWPRVLAAVGRAARARTTLR